MEHSCATYRPEPTLWIQTVFCTSTDIILGVRFEVNKLGIFFCDIYLTIHIYIFAIIFANHYELNTSRLLLYISFYVYDCSDYWLCLKLFFRDSYKLINRLFKSGF